MIRRRAVAPAAALTLVLAAPAAAATDSGGGCNSWTTGAEKFRVCTSSSLHKVRPDYYLDHLAAPAPGEVCRINAWLSREWRDNPRASVPDYTTWTWSRPWKEGHYVIELSNPHAYGHGTWRFGIAGVCTVKRGRPQHGWGMRYAPEQIIN